MNQTLSGNALNQTSHLPRFVQYARAHFSEKKRAYVWHFAVCCMIYFILLILINREYETDMQMVVYYMGLLVTGAIFSLRYFSELARPESGLLELMRPVSCFEKWLLAALVTMIAYPLVYSVLFVAMTAPFNWLYTTLIQSYKDPLDYQLFIPLKGFASPYNAKNITTLGQAPLWLFYLGLNSYALATSIFFKRLPIIKSVALGFALFLVMLFLLRLGSSDIEDVVNYWFDSKSYHFHLRAFVLGILCWFVAPFLMFFSSYFFLKGRDLA